MNDNLKNLLVGVALMAVCFGAGSGIKHLIKHTPKSKGVSVERIEDLEDRISRLESWEYGKLRRMENDISALQSANERFRRDGEALQRELDKLKNRTTGTEGFRGLQPNNRKTDVNADPEPYHGKTCHSQSDCGGVNSGYFCNYGGNHTNNTCERTSAKTYRVNGVTYYYNKLSDLKKWCRTATESSEDRAHPENCHWGYLSYPAAKAWCDSIGKQLVDPYTIRDNCDDFDFLPEANPDQTYWTTEMRVVHMGDQCSIQSMVRGDGYAAAAGIICQDK